LKFLNNSGQQVGSGSFSYNDDNTLTCIATTFNPSSCDPPGFAGEIFVTRLLTSFGATVWGETWGGLAGKAWWADSARDQSPAMQFGSRYGIFISNWLASNGSSTDPFPALRFDSINLSSESDNSATGTWTAQIPSLDSNQPNYKSGTFTATAIPEPLTILGSITAVVFGVAFKRKLHN
jgi:hypothetical protein